MLNQDILATLKSYMKNMNKSVTFVLQTGNHDKRDELVKFLQSIADTSEFLSVQQEDAGLRSPISFKIVSDGHDTGIRFSGIPSGHEFNSLVLAILQSGGTELKLEPSLQSVIKSISQQLDFEVFISLSCHNCPDVVQALNQFALLNDQITSEMIDGGLFQGVVKERDIQGVPSVYLNGELFVSGKTSISELIEKLSNFLPEESTSVSEKNSAALPIQDVTVIGGGPAGVSAAIYSARKGLKVTLIADQMGGQVKDTMAIENLISVPQTTGPQLVGALQQHMSDYDITIKENIRVARVDNNDIKQLTLSTGQVIETKTLIIATGAKWRELGVPGEKENIGNGVAYCPHCDGPFFKGKDVAVIGGGNSGIEAALDLAKIVKSVTVFEFMPELKADKVLVDQALKSSNISIKKNVATNQILASNGKVSAIEYTDRDTDTKETQSLDGVFVQIGLLPNSSFLEGVVERTQFGEIIIDEKCQTSTTGIYACGDVTTVPYKQIVISMGEGAKAALSAFEYLLLQNDD